MIPKEGEKIFIKNINSCFGNKDFTDYVKDDKLMNQSESIEYPAIWSISGTINIRPSPLYIDINNGYECNIINSPHLHMMKSSKNLYYLLMQMLRK